jgi:Protein of unknown function (DUF3102)
MDQLQTMETEAAGQRPLFDYSALDAETRIVVQQRAGEIKSIAKRVAGDIVEIGHKLADVKSRLKNGRFNEWLTAELGWSERTAHNFIAVYSRFGAANFALENVAVSALYLLAAPSTPAEAVEITKQIADSGEKVTHGVAKEIVRKARARRPKQVELVDEIEEEEAEEAAEEPETVEPQACRVCGCTEDDCRGCIEKTGEPCWWVEPGLCSACHKPVIKSLPKLIDIVVSRKELQEMDCLNAADAIDIGGVARIHHRGKQSFVITESPSHFHTVDSMSVVGWLVKPESEAGNMRLRNHPAELLDEVPEYPESYLGVRINVGSTVQPEWWVVTGPAYRFTMESQASADPEAQEPKAPIVHGEGTPVPTEFSQEEINLMGEEYCAAQNIPEERPVEIYYVRGNPYVITGAVSQGGKYLQVDAMPILPIEVVGEENAKTYSQANRARDRIHESLSYVGIKINCGSVKKPSWWVMVGPKQTFTVEREGSKPAPAAKVTPGAQSAQRRPPVATPERMPSPSPVPVSAIERPAAWFKTRVEISITLLPGGDDGSRKVMHSVRAGDGKDDVPFVQVSTGESELFYALPAVTRALVEKAAEAFSKKQAAKATKKTASKGKSSARPAAKAGKKRK